MHDNNRLWSIIILNNYIIVGSENGSIFFFLNYKYHSKIKDAHKCWIIAIVEGCNNNEIISCSNDNLIKIWNINNQHCLRILNGHSSSVWSIY